MLLLFIVSTSVLAMVIFNPTLYVGMFNLRAILLHNVYVTCDVEVYCCEY